MRRTPPALREIGDQDVQGNDKVASGHHRYHNIQAFDGCILAQHDDGCQHHQHHRRAQLRQRKRIIKRLAYRVADHLADAAPTDQTGHRKQRCHHRPAQSLAPLTLGQFMDIISRPAPVPAIQGVGLFIFLRQGGLHKCSGSSQQRREPHPEHCACAASRNSRHHAHQVAHAHAGSRGDYQGLKRGQAASGRFFAANGRHHIPEQANRQKPGTDGKIHTRCKQQDRHGRQRQRDRTQRQDDKIPPQQAIDRLDQLRQHNVSSL